MTQPWTPQQSDIFDDVSFGEGNTIVIARAGAGKTTTIEEAIRNVPRTNSVIYLAFSKEVATQAKGRLRHPRLTVATCHSFGYRILRENLGAVDVDKDRTFNMATSVARRKEDRYVLAKAAALAKGCLTEEGDELLDMLDEYGLEYAASKGGPQFQLASDVGELLTLCRDYSDGTVDHDDQIWLPVVDENIEIPVYDYVFVDEFQDLNAAQIELVMLAVSDGGRMFAVGDPAQQIFRFRGADKAAFKTLIERTDAKTLPLSTTFRCPVSVVNEARRYVPDITAREGAEEGIVRTVDRVRLLEEAEYGDFVLSRTNSQLVALAMDFIADGCRTMIMGREIGQGLVSQIYKLKPNDLADLKRKVVSWAEKKSARLMSKDPPQQGAADAAKDTRDCILLLSTKVTTIDELVMLTRELFETRDRTSCVVLATTHKAKGLEADRVWVLRDTYLMPWGDQEEERNLLYVAITRAKHELVYVTSRNEQ